MRGQVQGCQQLYIYIYIGNNLQPSQKGLPTLTSVVPPTESQSTRASPKSVPVVGSDAPRFPPYVIRKLHTHGAPAYEVTCPEVQSSQEATVAPETKRTKRYAEYGVIGISDLQHFILRQVC